MMPTQTVKKLQGKQIPPMLKSRVSSRQLKLNKDIVDDDVAAAGINNVQHWMKRRSSIWPLDNQNPYGDKDLQEVVTKTIACENPQLAKNLVEFSFKDGAFVPVTVTEQNIVLIDMESNCTTVVESSQATEEELQPDGVTDESEKTDTNNDSASSSLLMPSPAAANVINEEADSDKDVTAADDEISGDEAEDDDVKDEKSERSGSVVLAEKSAKAKKLMNQFNFCERATMTYNNPLRDEATQSTPLYRFRFSDQAAQWIIYDSYKDDYESQQKERERGKKEKLNAQVGSSSRKDDRRKQTQDENGNGSSVSSFAQAGLVLERMINQNTFEDVLYDFRYYEDPSDEYKEKEGTILPLWHFQFHDMKMLQVTDIKWHPRYFDMFATTFGSFDFQKQSSNGGYFCIWSLKSPSHPEYVKNAECGIMSIDFHPSQQYLLVCGLYDGSVAVYDVETADNYGPVYQSDSVGKKHDGVVWQVQWGETLPDGEMTFYSVSSDGKVFSWVLMRNELCQTLVINFSMDEGPIVGYRIRQEERTINPISNSGTCITFHPKDNSIFLVGTEEGDIFKCSMAYTSNYLFVYRTAHRMPVHRIDYNKYSSDIFATCSADWNIKIWEDNRSDPLFVFNVGFSASDVKWSPYSSTVLAAVTTDCKVYVYDLNVDKYKPICAQSVASKKQHKLTRIAFNWKLPVIIVGNDRGCITSLKLSPNLRKKPRIPKKQQDLNLFDLEAIKLEKVLSLVREPSASLLKFGKLSSSGSSTV